MKNVEMQTSRQNNLELVKALSIIAMLFCHPVIRLGIHHAGYETEFLFLLGDMILGDYLGVAHAFMFAMGVGMFYSRKNAPADLMRLTSTDKAGNEAIVSRFTLACSGLAASRKYIRRRKHGMKKLICIVICVVMLFALCACGAQKAPDAAAEWTRAGYFTDENENMLSVTWMEDIDEPGWYVGLMIGEIMAGGTLPQVENTLQGGLSTWEEGAEPIVVTVSEDGDDDLLLVIEGGESYHFTPYDMPEATIFVTVNTEGWGGMIGYEAGETVPELDPEWPYQSAQINLAEPETYTFAAAAEAGNLFVKWTKNGEDFSTEPIITVLLDESADFVAVFEEEPGWQNPVNVRQDGERFEAIIMLEGIEETVKYEHIRNEALGFEMDYEYESFVRNKEADRECFISVWDDLQNPENYLEVTYSAEDADTVAASIREVLSQEYELLESSRELDRAGDCIYIEASELKGTGTMAEELQAVYIVPASDGCFVATAHFSIESAEGIGRRFSYMMHSFSVI